MLVQEKSMRSGEYDEVRSQFYQGFGCGTHRVLKTQGFLFTAVVGG